MLSVLLNWLYIGVTVYCLGSGFSVFAGKIFGYRLKRTDSILVAGLIIATVYAQIFSLFAGVGLLANVVLIVGCAVILVLCGKSIKQDVLRRFGDRRFGKIIVLMILIFLWAYFTSRGRIHYDSDLYHGQSIRWIEEYGVVPGLGNLHERFAYNSSSFALSALYSMKFLTGRSLHTVSGFFALVLSISAMDITASWKRKSFLLSDYARIALIYYLLTIIDEVMAPASDYFIMCTVFFIVIKWIDCLEKAEKESVVPYALLCVAGVYAMTLKLTAGLILLLLIKPAYMLIRQKQWKNILKYLSMGLIVAIPWFVRTVVISGWLIYPFPAVDLFDFDWKMNAGLVAADAQQISAWGKAMYNIALLDTPISGWLPNWFMTTLSGMEKMLVLGCGGCVLLYVTGLFLMICRKKREHLDIALVIGTMIASYLFWQVSAPLMRYGYAYVLLTVCLVGGWIARSMNVQKFVYYIALAYGIYKIVMVGAYISTNYWFEFYIWQEDYGKYEMESYEVNGVTFYKPKEGDRTGYEYFPAAPYGEHFEFRGDGLEDGFRTK